MKVQEIVNQDVRYNLEVSSLSIDTRNIDKNDIFIAIRGSVDNGNNYIDEAIAKKVRTIVTDDKDVYHKYQDYPKLNMLYVRDTKKALAMYAKKFYHDIIYDNQTQNKRIITIGVTGTNGKTTTTTLIYKYFRYLGKKIALIGTNGIFINDEYYETKNTTPDILTIYKYLKLAIEKECYALVIEVSSQGIKEGRVQGIEFDIGLLTNITWDHIDYHKTYIDYYYTKILFLNNCNKVIINADLSNSQEIALAINQEVITYGKKEADYNISDITIDIEMSSFYLTIKNQMLERFYIVTSLLGEYNIYNVTSFIAIIDTLDCFNQYTLSFLMKKIIIDGRFEVIHNSKCTFIIDFAHSPDSVELILTYLNKIKSKRIITIIGMGGERDKTKRPIIGKITTTLSDYTIFTSDNSRSEKTIDIINDIIKGIPEELTNSYQILTDRREAIQRAYNLAKNGDIIAILGKGNEKNQNIDNTLIPFNDKEEVYKLYGK